MLIRLGSQRRAHIGHIHLRARRVDRVQVHVDPGHEQIPQHIHVLHAAGAQVEDRVYPDRPALTVAQREDRAFDVLCWNGEDELRVPVVSRPGAFAFGAEKAVRPPARER
jgi:hypothetical protein